MGLLVSQALGTEVTHLTQCVIQSIGHDEGILDLRHGLCYVSRTIHQNEGRPRALALHDPGRNLGDLFGLGHTIRLNTVSRWGFRPLLALWYP